MKRCRLAALLLVVCFLVGCAPKRTVTVEQITTQAPTQTTVVTTETTGTEFTTNTTDATSLATGTTTGEKKTSSGRTTTKTKYTTTTVTTTTTRTTTTTAPPVTVGDEMRGAWVSYIELAEVLQSCSTPTAARTALDKMMKGLADRRINTVFFHVRANSDAYYDSAIFKPAAAASKLIAVGFDPLAYAVEAAHRNGMQLHAWVNPYRVGANTAYLISDIPTLTDASNRYYYVPTSTAAQTLILNGVREILNKYDVDGIQYDDYFYPQDTLVATTVYSFESADYTAYKNAGGKLSVADWRRAGVDALIAGTHTLTAAKGVVFGVSPAVSADNTYNTLYADCRKWLAQSGYVDYLCPQIYTGFDHATSPFETMVNTWQSYPRHSSVKLYVGVALYKIGLKSDTYAGTKGKTEWLKNSDVMKRSVLYLRQKKVKGIAFYSYSYFEPASKAGLSSTADISVAKKEIENLMDVL